MSTIREAVAQTCTGMQLWPNETDEIVRALAVTLGVLFIFVGCLVLFGGLEGQFLRWVTGPLSAAVGVYFVCWGLVR